MRIYSKAFLPYQQAWQPLLLIAEYESRHTKHTVNITGATWGRCWRRAGLLHSGTPTSQGRAARGVQEPNSFEFFLPYHKHLNIQYKRGLWQAICKIIPLGLRVHATSSSYWRCFCEQDHEVIKQGKIMSDAVGALILFMLT